MTEQLKPCPFCGGEDFDVTTEQVEWCSFVGTIECRTCEISFSPMYGDSDNSTACVDAIAAWNRRAP
jgi:Lar family restriction alleviation protein